MSVSVRVVPAILLLLLSLLSATPRPGHYVYAGAGGKFPDLQSLWDYSDPEGTRARFLRLLPAVNESGQETYRLELLTQIARTWGLESQFSAAHAVLDEVEQSSLDDYPLARLRYLLERGRVYRSAGDTDTALTLFRVAYDAGRAIGADFFTVDAAHMLALTARGPGQKREWNQRGLEIAAASANPRARAWGGSLHNNMGWDCFDRREYDQALDHFTRALAFRQEEGDAGKVRVARWCIARTLRAAARFEEALAIQLELWNGLVAEDTTDGYVSEELGELFLAKGDTSASRAHFARAWRAFARDSLMIRDEPGRLARLRLLGGLESVRDSTR